MAWRNGMMVCLVSLMMTGMVRADPMQLDPDWRYVADRVMGGVSSGALRLHDGATGPVAQLTGQVSLDNNGGFIQMAFDVDADARGWSGIEMDVRGNGETYELRLKTDQLSRPWQSFRAPFVAGPDWQTIRFEFDAFEAHRTDAVFDAAQLRRIGVLAIGRAFEADVSVANVRFFR